MFFVVLFFYVPTRDLLRILTFFVSLSDMYGAASAASLSGYHGVFVVI